MHASRQGKTVALMMGIVVMMAPVAIAEAWPTLANYVPRCVVIIKARAVEVPDEKGRCTLEVLESWKGKFDPADFAGADGNRIHAAQGEHGVQVVRGQEIILFYTRENQPEKIHTHSTAFPISDGKIIYASTNRGLREEMTVEAFKQRIAAIVASTQPATQPTTKPAGD